MVIPTAIPSADLSAGMTMGGCHAKAAQTQIQTRPRLAYCRPRMVLTKGSTLLLVGGRDSGSQRSRKHPSFTVRWMLEPFAFECRLRASI